jgi:predicted aspartyl protease
VTSEVDPVAVIAAVRGALHFDEERAKQTELRATGVGTIAGLPAALRWRCHVDGRTRIEIASALPETSAFDGLRGMHVGPSGVLEPLDLADLDELRMTSALFSGSWLDPRTRFVYERAAREGDTVTIAARIGSEEWRQPFRIVCGISPLRPKRLETLGGDRAVFEVEGFAPGVFCDVPRRVRWRRGWLSDTVEITRVESMTGKPSYVLHDSRGAWTAQVDPSAPALARVTRSPRGRLPLVRASIDGRDAGWFLLDTGAGASAIEALVADGLGLTSLGRTWVMAPTGGMGSSYRRCRALRVGPITLPEALLVELDLSSISAALGVRLAGIVGFDLFAQAVVHLGSRPPAVELFAAGDDRQARWQDVRFQHRVPVLAAHLTVSRGAQSAGLVALDTGSSARLVLHERVAQQLELTQWTTRRGVRGVAGADSLGVRMLARIDLGSARFERVRALIAGSLEGMVASPTLLGSVGWPLFAGRKLILDWSRRRIAILDCAPD